MFEIKTFAGIPNDPVDGSEYIRSSTLTCTSNTAFNGISSWKKLGVLYRTGSNDDTSSDSTIYVKNGYAIDDGAYAFGAIAASSGTISAPYAVEPNITNLTLTIQTEPDAEGRLILNKFFTY